MEEFIKKLIGRLEDEKDKVPVNRLIDDIIKDKPKELGQLIAYRRSIEIVNQLAEEHKGGWIPCSKRLPELFETYIVTIKMKYEWEKEWEYHVDVADYTCDDGYVDGAWNTFNDWCEGQECHVIAWQPLPEPYKEENS